jgi:hypothetical protein
MLRNSSFYKIQQIRSTQKAGRGQDNTEKHDEMEYMNLINKVNRNLRRKIELITK